MRDSYLVFGAPGIGDAEIREVEETLRSGWIGTGPKVARFEDAFRSFTGGGHAVATSSGSAALHLALIMADVGAGDEVITTPMTFCATVNAILHTGAKPVLADVDPGSQCLDPERAAAAITDRTRAILPVHFAGHPCDMTAFRTLADEHELLLIDDAAHALEATWDGARIGTLADATCFSFYVTKNITTIEGGMITTPHGEWAARSKILALHGMESDAWGRFSDDGYRHYQVVGAGFKYNMTDVEACIGLHQLGRAEHNHVRRCEIWSRYDAELAETGLELPSLPRGDSVHGRHLYTVLADPARIPLARDELQQRLHELNIGTGVHYVAIHSHPFYQQALGVAWGDFPHTERISSTTLSLPLSPYLSDDDVGDVIDGVTHLCRGR